MTGNREYAGPNPAFNADVLIADSSKRLDSLHCSCL
jgi:hypothetical protein